MGQWRIPNEIRLGALGLGSAYRGNESLLNRMCRVIGGAGEPTQRGYCP